MQSYTRVLGSQYDVESLYQIYRTSLSMGAHRRDY